MEGRGEDHPGAATNTEAPWETWGITVLRMKASRRESRPPSKTCRAANRKHAMRSDGPSDSAPWQGFAFENGYGEGNGTPLQHSCLENPRDGGAWWAAGYGVTQSRTRLKRLSSSRVRITGKQDTYVEFSHMERYDGYWLFSNSVGLRKTLQNY